MEQKIRKYGGANTEEQLAVSNISKGLDPTEVRRTTSAGLDARDVMMSWRCLPPLCSGIWSIPNTSTTSQLLFYPVLKDKSPIFSYYIGILDSGGRTMSQKYNIGMVHHLPLLDTIFIS